MTAESVNYSRSQKSQNIKQDASGQRQGMAEDHLSTSGRLGAGYDGGGSGCDRDS